MLQRYPDLSKRVDVLVSLAGFAHRDDFTMSRTRLHFYRLGARALTLRLPAWLFRQVCLRPFVLEQVYAHSVAPGQEPLKRSKRRPLDYDIKLWRQNDVRTHMATLAAMLAVDNCQAQIDLAVWHVSMRADRYVNNHIVEQHLKVIFRDYHHASAKASVYNLQTANRSAAVAVLPTKLRRRLART
jgi:hypothetical protein